MSISQAEAGVDFSRYVGRYIETFRSGHKAKNTPRGRITKVEVTPGATLNTRMHEMVVIFSGNTRVYSSYLDMVTTRKLEGGTEEIIYRSEAKKPVSELRTRTFIYPG